MCVRYRNEKTNLSLWVSANKFEGSEQILDSGSEFFPGSIGLIGIQKDSGRSLSSAHWGLTPAWTNDPKFGKKSAYNARSETLHEKPTYKSAFKVRRCLIPANSFYERNSGRWLRFQMEGEQTFAIAGLYELPNRNCSSLSYSMVTTTPNSLIADIHDRMPVILAPEAYDLWLDLKTPQEVLKGLFTPCPSEWLKYEDAGPVGKKKASVPE